MEYLFKRLQAYIKIQPTAAMIGIIVKIMVAVISIFGIVTKEVEQGRTSMHFPIKISLKLDLHTAYESEHECITQTGHHTVLIPLLAPSRRASLSLAAPDPLSLPLLHTLQGL